MAPCYTGLVNLSHFLRAALVSSVLGTGCGELINEPALPPLADGGPDVLVAPGTAVTLDAGASQDGSAAIDGYAWTLLGAPEGSTATLAPASPTGDTVTLTPDQLGSYLVSLVVSSGGLSSSPDLVVVTAASVNAPPTLVLSCAPMSDCEVLHGQSQQLDGRGTFDPEGEAFTLQWTQIRDPADCIQCPSLNPCAPADVEAPITNDTLPLASFQAPQARDISLVFALTASEGSRSVSDCIAYEVTNQAPTVLVDSSTPTVNPAIVAEGDSFTLSATSSFDPDPLDTLTFEWTQTAGPAAVLGTPSGATVPVTAPTIAEPPGLTPTVQLTFAITADDGVDQTIAELTVTVQNN